MAVSNKKRMLIVLGAGPGDPDLLTVKGYKALQDADVILYDNLVNKEMLAMASPSCKRVFVGKIPYGLSTSQDEINQLILKYVQLNGTVVRLKGGDPFIFGRGFEEIQFARTHGIETLYIPGITSMQTSGLHDIPLTHRNVSEGVWILTGTKKDGSLSSDLHLAIQSKSTVVIYMGMKKLSEIAETYTNAGKGFLDAAMIQEGSLAHQRKIVCKVKDLYKISMEENMGSPAIIIIGDVITLINRI